MFTAPHLGLDLPTTSEDRTHILVTSFSTSGPAHMHQHAVFLPHALSQTFKRAMAPSKSRFPSSINDSADFEHQRLDPSKDQIRLVRLLPGTSSDDIQCELKVWDLASSPSYIALSYTWGDAGSTQLIHVNGKRHQVRDNLFDFLSIYLSTEKDATGKDTWLWIDQLCIDQSHVQERNHQVSLMSRIYQGSVSVIVWLGCDIKLVTAAEEYATTGSYSTLKPLFRSVYFTRLWIVQEILLAPYLRVLCGSTWISHETMRYLAEICSWDAFPNVSLSLFSEGAVDFENFDVPILHHDESYTDRRLTSLKVDIKRYSGNHCADPRDKVYGLLGLVNDVNLQPDYGKSVEEVFLDAVRAVAPSIGRFYYDEDDDVVDDDERLFSLSLQLARNMGLTSSDVVRIFGELNQIFEQRSADSSASNGAAKKMIARLRQT
ncbi:heterokaryon incompatibility protein-domain-containing protein [Paraphoma chrysanthemicola]|nr:heterokaryon incompatibility protein-domain-containing protein [Paraphoma chrysanthemicola]